MHAKRLLKIFLLLLLFGVLLLQIIGATNSPVLVLITGVINVIFYAQDAFELVNDRLIPDHTPESRPISTDPKTQIDDYLSGKLREFEKESALFVPLAGETRVQTKYSAEAEKREFQSIDEAISLYGGRFVLIGDPGAGKSTTLRDLMRKQIDLYRSDPAHHRLPVWINLGLSSNPVDAAALIKFWWEQQGYLPDTPEKYIKLNNLMLFLDGLNEMPEAGGSRKARAESLRAFLDKYPNLPVIVACRISEYRLNRADADHSSPPPTAPPPTAPPTHKARLTTEKLDADKLDLGLPVVRVNPLDPARIQAFIANYTADAVLWDRLQANDALKRMAANPYNLSMVIEVFKARRALPEDLNDLYRMYLEDAYQRNRDERTKRQGTATITLDWAALEARLKRLAYRMIVEGRGTAAPYDWARQQIGRRALRDGINLGVLLENAGEIRYFHQSLQGYFAIEHLSRALRAKQGRFDRFRPDPVNLIRQIGDMGENGAPAVEALIGVLGDKNNDTRRAAQITLVKIGTSAVEPLIRALGNKRLLVRFSAAPILGRIGDVRAVESLIQGLSSEDLFWRSATAKALGEIGDKHTVEPLIKLLSDEDNFVRSSAAEALGSIGDERAVEPLIKLLSDKVKDVRFSAALALGNIGNVRAVEPLIELLSDKAERHFGNAETVADAAAKALRKIRTPDALEALRKAGYTADEEET